MLVVTGGINSKILNDTNAKTLMHDICEEERYIGEDYLKLHKLKGITEIDVLRVIRNIVLKYKLTEKEVNVMIERFELINNVMRRGYQKQYLWAVVQLRDCKNKLETLYNCRIVPKSEREFIVHKRKNGGPIVYEIDILDKISVHKGGIVICDDLKYILYNDEELRFISKNEANERKEKDRYKFKISYRGSFEQ